MFFALGNPRQDKVVEALGGLSFAQFPPLNFVGGQPDYNRKNEGPGKRGPAMEKIEIFLEANKGKKFLPNDPALRKAFQGVFAGNELTALYDVSQQLNGEKDMRGVKNKKLKPEELKAMVKKIPILIEAHVSVTDGSTDGNQILSDNRARAVQAALILFGIDPERTRAMGAGESNPIVPETVDWTKTGKHVTPQSVYTWAKDKNRRVMFWVDTDKLEAAEGKVEATVPAPKTVLPPAVVPPGAAVPPGTAIPPGAAIPPPGK